LLDISARKQKEEFVDLERIVMKLIVESGNAKSKSMEAIMSAKAGDIEKARDLYRESGTALAAAHEIQTDLIQDESDGKLGTPTMLFIHAQDHLMGAILAHDLALEIIDLYERMGEKK
jgi:PTS system cellobiose-specific IIA component